MKNLRYLIPNSLTLLNLLSGCVAITLIFKGENEYTASWFILIAAFFDLLDGLAARALNAKSQLGAQLDSLADVVSFGVAPSMIFFSWFNLVLTQHSSTYEMIHATGLQNFILYSSFLFAISSALRLARFNVSSSESRYFQGLPTPAASLIVAAIWLILGSTESEKVRFLILNTYVVYGVLLFLFFLMISRIRMISLKFEGVGLSKNLNQYVLIVVSLALLILFKLEGIIYCLLFYLLYSFVSGFFPPEEE